MFRRFMVSKAMIGAVVSSATLHHLDKRIPVLVIDFDTMRFHPMLNRLFGTSECSPDGIQIFPHRHTETRPNALMQTLLTPSSQVIVIACVFKLELRQQNLNLVDSRFQLPFVPIVARLRPKMQAQDISFSRSSFEWDWANATKLMFEPLSQIRLQCNKNSVFHSTSNREMVCKGTDNRWYLNYILNFF